MPTTLRVESFSSRSAAASPVPLFTPAGRIIEKRTILSHHRGKKFQSWKDLLHVLQQATGSQKKFATRGPDAFERIYRSWTDDAIFGKRPVIIARQREVMHVLVSPHLL